MKKQLIYIAALLSFAACDRMNDIQEEEGRAPYTKNLTITLTEDDYADVAEEALLHASTAEDTMYAESVEKNNAFNDSVTANDYVPFLMHQNYPALEFGSVANVTFNTTVKPEELAQYESATAYTVSDADYANVGGLVALNNSFSAAAPASAMVPDILAANFPDAEAGDAAGVTYKYALELSDVYGYAYTYDGYEDQTDVIDQDGWSQVITQGTLTWQFRDYNDNGYIQYSAYGGTGIQESYIISPAINLADGSLFNFDLKFGWYNGNPLEVLISSDYNGDVTTATWTNITSELTFPQGIASGFTDFEAVGPASLSTFSGKIYVAFKYTGDSEGITTTVQIDNFAVTPLEAEASSSVKQSDMYTFDGTAWSEADVDMLDAAAYDAMGDPGKYDNFSSSDAPQDYIPTYLTQVNPYAQDGDEVTVVYAYYGASTPFGADVYTKESGEWSSISEINKIAESAQFFYATNGWVFDPAIRVSMTATDYQMMVDYVAKEISEDYLDSYGNTEYYYGNASYYANIDMRQSYRIEKNVPLTDREKATYGVESWSDDLDKSAEIIFDRVKYESMPILLQLKYPNSPTHASGVEQTYEITFLTYENDLSKNYYTYKYKCVVEGDLPVFEFVSDITE